MNLKDFLSSREKPPELFWSLVLEPGWVQAGLWFIKGTEAEVVSCGPASPWEAEEDLIGATDAALSSAIQKLPEQSREPSKTVFGVPSAWVSGGEIKEEFLNKIKKVCTELSLEPVGFVVLPEAIAHLYKSEEGAPVSAVVVGLGKEFLEITIFTLGNLVGTTSVARSVSLIEDVNEGLSRFEGASPLPSRIIVYDGREGEVEEAKDALLSANWEGLSLQAGNEKVKFLHTPKVESLSVDRKVFATSLAGASEIGHASHISLKVEEAEPVFISDEHDVANVSEPLPPVTPGDLGFAVGEDVSENRPREQEASVPPASYPSSGPKPPRSKISFSRIIPFDKVKTLFHSLSGKLALAPRVERGLNKKNVYFSVGFGITILIAIFLFWWFYPKATVLVYVSPRSYEGETQINIDVSGVSDIANAVIPGRALDAKVTGTKTAATTGSKLIGDKAKGSVEIANGNPDSIDVTRGTTLSSLSGSGLGFTTDAEASISGQTVPGKPGKATLSVTAADIGAQFNVVKGEVFKVDGYDSHLVAATAQNDFSGGTSQQILAVSDDDQNKLESGLTSELNDKALDNISSQASGSEIAVPVLVSTDKIDETFSNKVGDEASTLKLDLQLDAKGIAVDKSKLIEFAKNILKDKIPQGFVLNDDQINFKFTFLKLKSGKYNFKLTVSANFLPIVQTDKIISQISGKTTDAAETYLAKIPGFRRAEVKIVSLFPSFLRILPMVKNNINLEIVGEKS